MDKFIYIFAIIFFVAVVLVILYLVLNPMFKQRKLLSGVVNYDTLMRKFVFSIDCTKEEFYCELQTRNVNDVMEYDFDEESYVISFIRNNAKFSYRIMVDEFDGNTLLCVEQMSMIMDRGNVPYLINKFFIMKFNAKPIDYRQYSF